ncbi:hypothetical protein [Sphingobacterium sp.]|uniref:hypothetical protein n=1 Tax=Sphingobacterium sp. TaxID=341027 RepID=UPI0031D245CE
MIKVLSLKCVDLKVFSSEQHLRAIHLDEKDMKKVSYQSIRVIEGNWKSWFGKVFLESYNAVKIFRKARIDRPSFVYISSVFPISQLFIKIIKKFFPDIHVIIGLHGEMEFLKSNKSSKLRFLGWFLKNSFKIRGNNLKYLVFGDVIKENLKAYNFLPPTSLLSIDHPYDYRDGNRPNLSKLNGLKLGTIGIGSVNKRTHNLFLLAEAFKNQVLSNEVSFGLIGTMLPDLEPFVNAYVKTNGSNMILSKKEFEDKIFELHYSLFFYDNEFYSLCASGAFFDAVKFEKPILAIKNDYFSYYFDRLGNIGYLFDNLEDMKVKIAMLLFDNYEQEYLQQVANLQRAKRTLSIENISRDFFYQLRDTGFCDDLY